MNYVSSVAPFSSSSSRWKRKSRIFSFSFLFFFLGSCSFSRCQAAKFRERMMKLPCPRWNTSKPRFPRQKNEKFLQNAEKIQLSNFLVFFLEARLDLFSTKVKSWQELHTCHLGILGIRSNGENKVGGHWARDISTRSPVTAVYPRALEWEN